MTIDSGRTDGDSWGPGVQRGSDGHHGRRIPRRGVAGTQSAT